MRLEIHIILDPQLGKFEVQGVPGDPIIGYGMLDMAKDAVRRQYQSQQRKVMPVMFTPPPSDFKPSSD